MSQSVTFLKPWQLFYKAWKVYEIQAKITGKSRRVPEGTWVLREGMEIPCQYTSIGPKIHKKTVEKN